MKTNYFSFLIVILGFLLYNFCMFAQPTNEYIPDENTVLLLHLNETSGNTAYDASSFGNNGTINGNEPSEGRFFGGRQFPSNNTDIGIQLPNSSSLDIAGILTLEAWIKIDGYEMGGTFIIQHNEYQLDLGSFGSSGHLQFSRHVDNQWITYQTDEQLPLNQWVHIAGIYDGINYKLYINGVLKDATLYQNNYSTVGIPRVATYEGSILNPSVTTLVDEIRISNVVRFLSPVAVRVDKEQIPDFFELFQNYPNPFNPTTKISYVIKESSNIQLKVLDILGNEISTLVNEEKSAGSYSIDFDGHSLSSGIYLYQLKAGNFIQTKKMILLK